MIDLKAIELILCCLSCRADLTLRYDEFTCNGCQRSYPIIEGVARFVPVSFYARSEEHHCIQEKTKNYFGFQWDYFKDWGFIPDNVVPAAEKTSVYGGTVASRESAFSKKCRLNPSDLSSGKVVLDAGCGNGRYTYEASLRGEALIIGVDIGYGSVKSAYQNNQKQPNVIIIQASLFDLPFKDGVIDSCFSNGVLMHTGNAPQAFGEVARCVKPFGVFVAHVYHRLNPVWEFNDYWIRQVSTRLSIEQNLVFAKFMAVLGRQIDRIPGALKWVNYFVRIMPTQTHNFDWYSAPVASHHTYSELLSWFEKSQFTVTDPIPQKTRFFSNLWGINLKGQKLITA